MNTLKISVIIPFYNVSRLLFERCLDSVFCQTYSDYEIIVVDDGSTDCFKHILEDIQYKHPDIRIIHQDNQGVSVARNRGIAESFGDYITFLDADDMLTPYFLEQAVSLANQFHVGYIIGGVHICDDPANWNAMGQQKINEDSLMEFSADNINKLSTKLIFDPIQYQGGYISRGPVARLIDRNLAAKCLFEPGIEIGEDIVWNQQILLKYPHALVQKQTWYLYSRNPESVTHRFDPSFPDRFQKHIVLLEQTLDLTNDEVYRNYCLHISEGICNTFEVIIKKKGIKTDTLQKYRLMRSLYTEKPWIEFKSLRFLKVGNGRDKVKALLYRFRLFFFVLMIQDIIRNKD